MYKGNGFRVIYLTVIFGKCPFFTIRLKAGALYLCNFIPMESFQLIPPSAPLAPYVRNYWFLTCGPSDEPQRIIPEGCVSLVFHRRDRLFFVGSGDFQPRSFLCGQASAHYDLRQSGEVDMIHVTFRPFGARMFFGMPVDEARGLTVPVDALGDKGWTELEERLNGEPDNRRCVGLIEEYLLQRFSRAKAYNIGRMDAAVRAIDAGETDVRRLAAVSCLGYKQFKRVFAEYVGANPRDFLRVVRFQRALYLKQHDPETTLVQLAADAGCYDQAHLTREFKAFSGYTPAEYFSTCDPYSDYFTSP